MILMRENVAEIAHVSPCNMRCSASYLFREMAGGISEFFEISFDGIEQQL